jgi:hypothetical protein
MDSLSKQFVFGRSKCKVNYAASVNLFLPFQRRIAIKKGGYTGYKPYIPRDVRQKTLDTLRSMYKNKLTLNRGFTHAR